MGLCIQKQFFILSANTSSTVGMVRNRWNYSAWGKIYCLFIHSTAEIHIGNDYRYTRPCCVELPDSFWPVIVGPHLHDALRVKTLETKVVTKLALATLISHVFVCTVHRRRFV